MFYFKTPALAGRGLGGFVILIFQSVMRVLRLVAQLGGGLMAVLIFPAAQRAEYRADGLAAQAAGTAALLTLTRKLYLPQAVQNIYHKARFDPTTHILQEIRERAGRVPDREWLRIDRVIALGETRLAPTHPTTQARLALLRARPAEAGQVTLSAAEWAAVMQGLRGYEHLVEHQIRQAVMEKS